MLPVVSGKNILRMMEWRYGLIHTPGSEPRNGVQTEEEIHDVLASGFFIPAKYNRLGKAKIYLFRKERHRTYYEQKRVEVYYLVENNRIVVVTVYVFYGQWENEDERTL